MQVNRGYRLIAQLKACFERNRCASWCLLTCIERRNGEEVRYVLTLEEMGVSGWEDRRCSC